MCVFQNDVSEQEQRWGAKTIEGSGRKEHIRLEVHSRDLEINHSFDRCREAQSAVWQQEEEVGAEHKLSDSKSPNMGNIQ